MKKTKASRIYKTQMQIWNQKSHKAGEWWLSESQSTYLVESDGAKWGLNDIWNSLASHHCKQIHQIPVKKTENVKKKKKRDSKQTLDRERTQKFPMRKTEQISMYRNEK